MLDIQISEIVGRLKQRLNLRKDKDLAERMELKRPAVLYNWLDRGTVPWEEIFYFCEKENIDFYWVITGKKLSQPVGVSEEAGNYEDKWEHANHVHAVNKAIDELCAEYNLLLPESVRRDVFDFAFLYKFDNTALRKLLVMIRTVAQAQQVIDQSL